MSKQPNPGEIIRAHRIAKGLRQREAAGIIGISLQRYQRYEKWSSRPSHEMLERIMLTLGIPPERLFKTGSVDDSFEEFEKKIQKYSEVINMIEKDPRLIVIFKAYKNKFF